MWCFKTFCLLLFTLLYCGFSKGENSMLLSCRADDIPCLKTSTRIFLNATAKGIPQYDILAIDPITIPELKLQPDDKNIDLVYTVTNLIVTGLKDEDVTDFKIDRKTFDAELQVLIPNLEIEGNINIALASNRSCSVSGKYSAKGAVSLIIRYNCPIEKYEDGKEHFVVGPEKTVCENVGIPSFTLDNKLIEEIQQVKEIMEERQKLQNTARESLLQGAMCKLAQEAYVSVIHNTRAAAKILPKDAFMKDF